MRAAVAAVVLVSIACTAAAAPLFTAPVGRVQATSADGAATSQASRALRAFDRAAVYGPFNQLAYFFVDVYIGTPPQRATVILDTGSSVLAVPCAGCTSCGTHMDPAIDVDKSSTHEYVTCAEPGDLTCSRCTDNHCSYHIAYAEGSKLEGIWMSDVLWIGSNDSPMEKETELGVPFHFGCHTRETNLFVSQIADGIMGVSPRDTTIMAALQRAGKLDHYLFSVCLTPKGGVLSIGDYNRSIHLADAQFTPFAAGTSFYTVHVRSLQVEGQANHSHSTTADIVDTGTSFTYMPRAMYKAVKSSVRAFCANGAGVCKGTAVSERGESLCWRLESPDDVDTFPFLYITLDGGVELDMPPRALFTNMAWYTHSNSYCLGVYDNGASGNFVLGANALMYHDVIFDIDGSQVGFAPSKCNATDVGSLESYYGDHTRGTTSQYSRTSLIAIIGGIIVCAVFAVVGFITYLRRPARRGAFSELEQLDVGTGATTVGGAAPGTVGGEEDNVLASDDDDVAADDGVHMTAVPPPSPPSYAVATTATETMSTSVSGSMSDSGGAAVVAVAPPPMPVTMPSAPPLSPDKRVVAAGAFEIGSEDEADVDSDSEDSDDVALLSSQ